MDDIQKLGNFTVSIYGTLTLFEKNPLLSLARVRIFYKGLNRNRTYISEEFAEKLLATLPYTPVSGIWSSDDGDFEDHGHSREEGRIYGIVPEDPNITWEDFEDEDGETRTYACCDVVLFTTRYKDASKIIGKSQSMELYDKSIKGNWKFEHGTKFYEYTDGCFIGLQALGDDVEPCFEGSAFFTYAKSLKEMVEELKNYTSNTNKGGNAKMINFKLSDSAKYDAIWSLLNVNYNKEGDWTVDVGVIDVYDTYAFVRNYEDGKFYNINYTKNDETDTVELGEKEEVFIVSVNAKEKETLDALRVLNNSTFEKLDEVFAEKDTSISTLTAEKATLETSVADKDTEIGTYTTTIEGLNETITTLTTQAETFTASINTLTTEKADLVAERDSLNEFKLAREKEVKEEAISQYSNLLTEEVIAEFTSKIPEITLIDLKRDLANAYVDANAPAIFSSSNNLTTSHLIPTGSDSETLTGAARLIKNHKMKNNGGK